MNKDLRDDLVAAVDQQIVSPETPYVGKTYHRLLKLGLGEVPAKLQIVYCLCEEMEQIMKKPRSFDESAYRKALDTLPIELEIEDA
ncbi:MAG: hypothetical protein ABI600_00530 [Luteolibacter sp.]